METTNVPSTTVAPWYFTGFIESSGTFTFSRGGKGLALYFAVKLPASDRPLLESLQRALGGVGKIYAVSPPRIGSTPRPGARPMSYLRVCRRDELPKVVEHFERYPLQGTKRRTFEIWREMVRLKQGSPGRPPTERLNRLAEKLAASQ